MWKRTIQAPDPADVTFEPNVIDMMADREIIKSVCISEELKTIYEIFLNYLKGSGCCQKNAVETVNEVRRIGIIIKAQSINDFLKANLIRDVYLGVCNEKGCKPDSIRKYFRSLNEFYTILIIRRSEISLPLKSRNSAITEKRHKMEFCTLSDNLFVIIELGNAHRSGVCAIMLLSEYNKREFKDNFWMIYFHHYKTFYSSRHAVVIMTQEDMERLETFVKIRKQSKPSMPNIFVSWTGSKMA